MGIRNLMKHLWPLTVDKVIIDSILFGYKIYSVVIFTVKIKNIGTDERRQTLDTQIRPLL